MRIQRLQIGAFGPFADTVTLDFEALNDAGLFLLAGPNGAGKSSILDAVCFALYGAIPGDRGGAKRFRSDHAGPGQAPIVELEATFSSGTYRIVRTAAWERPRKRGTGTTPQQSTVSLSRRVGEGWEPVTTRLDEAGHLVTGLVGMSFVQFCQVVILPQGKFQAFLRATADERRTLLQQLFHTGRFQRVEAWLRDHRLALGRASREQLDAVREVIDRVSEIAGVPLPATPQHPGSAEDVDRLGWVDGLIAEAESSVTSDAAAVVEAASVERATRASLEAGRELAGRIARHRAAVAEEADLAAVGEEIQGLRDRVSRARRAAPVMALAPLARSRGSELTVAESHDERSTAALVALLGDAPSELPATVAELTAAAHRLEALRPHALESEALTVRLSECDAERRCVDARAAELAAADDAAQVAVLTCSRTEIQAATIRMPAVEALLTDGRARLGAHAEMTRLSAEHAAALADVRLATDAMLTAKDTWLAVREARIDGMAAELAGQLAVGADCPVCGSADHPYPAAPGSDAPDDAAEQAAHRALDDAKAAEFAHTSKVRDLATLLDQARARVGETSPDDLAATVAVHAAERDTLIGLVARSDAVESALAQATRRVSEARAEDQRFRERRIAVDAERHHLATRLAVLEGELATALEPAPYDTLDEAVDGTRRALAAAATARDAALALALARRAVAEAAGALVTAALESGFVSPEEAEAAHLPGPRLDDTVQLLQKHDARLAAVRGLLTEPDLAAVADAEAPDEAGLRVTHDRALDALTAATSRRERSTHRHARLSALRGDLSDRLDAWAPMRERLATVTHLSSFCEGKSPDNRWQMQLSAYVVAWRLEQVAEAANARLAVMTHGRYALEHTDERGTGDRRGGLGLAIRDDWTGVTRDPVTLSGGETFVAALALALGLADVITAEAGGATLQTLFVDEGFGSLDATSLDQVLDTLDSLRASGRTVGVVSHVAEMRSRIPVQLQVRKPADGGPSTVRMRV